MRSMFRLCSRLASVITLLCLVTTTPTQAAAKEIIRYRFDGELAEADFYGRAGCVDTWVYLHAVDGRIKAEGRPTMQFFVAGSVTQIDTCTDAYHHGSFSQALDADAFAMDKQFQAATLHTTVQACGSECFPVTVQLSWTGRGDRMHHQSHIVYTSGAYEYRYRSTDQWRQAGVSGQVATPWGSLTAHELYGSLRSSKSGQMEVYQLES